MLIMKVHGVMQGSDVKAVMVTLLLLSVTCTGANVAREPQCARTGACTGLRRHQIHQLYKRGSVSCWAVY